MKAKLALLEESPSSSQNPKTFQPKNKGFVTKTLNWDEEEVSDDEEVTQVKVLMALTDDELTDGKSHARNGEWVDITIREVNTLLFMDKDADWQNYLDQLLNFNTERILVPESQVVNESLKTTEVSTDPESSNDYEAEPTTPLPPLNILKGALPSSKEAHLVTDSGCSRSMTGVKSYLHKYVEQPRPKIVFGDNSSCITEGYGSINYGGIVFTKVAFVNGLKYNLISISQLCDAKYIVQFDDKQRIIYNAKKEIVLIAPRRNDMYVLDMSSLSPNGACFFAKASESVNWLWHKRLSHFNFKKINKLAKQNKVLGLSFLVYTKEKPYTICEKGKHHRALFKTKQNFSIKKCLHLLHVDLFRPVSPISINHEKYTPVIVDKYSRDKGSEGNIPPADMKPIHLTIVDPSGTGAKYQTFADVQAFLLSEYELDKESDEEEVLAAEDDMDEDPQVAEEVRTPPPKQDQLEPSHVQESTSDSSSLDLKRFDNILPLTKRQLIKYLWKMSRVLLSRITKKQ
nr:retrovirus-related Pol polyprotein from transposon TNT 1-94 [Tanacetum cinerariifolium]